MQTYVPEIPDNKENPSSKPKYRQLSSKTNLPPRLALGSLSGNVSLAAGKNNDAQQPLRAPPHSLSLGGGPLRAAPPTQRPLALSSLDNRPSLLQNKPQSALNNSDQQPKTGTDELSRIIHETNARNAARLSESQRGSSSSLLAFRRKSLVAGDMLLSNNNKSNLHGLYSNLASNPARLKGTVAPVLKQVVRSVAAPSAPPPSCLVVESTKTAQTLKTVTAAPPIPLMTITARDLQKASPLMTTQNDLQNKAAVEEEETVSTSKDVDEEHEQQLAEKEAQAQKEEEARAFRRKQQREEELQKKGSDLVVRARALESAGQTAAALALFREACAYLPAGTDDMVKARMDKLRATLRGAITQQQDDVEEQDPLEALFKSSSISPIAAETTQEVPARTMDQKKDESGGGGGFLVRLTRAVDEHMTIDQRKAGAFKQLLTIVRNFFEISSVQMEDAATYQGSKVRFHPMDCAIDPPPHSLSSVADDEFESSLFSVDRIIDALSVSSCVLNPNKKLDFWRSICEEFSQLLMLAGGEEEKLIARYLSCTLYFASGQKECACVSCHSNAFTHCHFGAISPRERLGRMLSTGLRACLRRVFNRSGDDDVAAVLHQALLLFETRQALVDSIVLLGKRDEEQIARVGEFVEAHTFLSRIFPNETACLELCDADSACWAKIRKYLAVAREHKCEDELVLAPLASLPDLVRKLQGQKTLASAARQHVDLAFRKAAKEDLCGQCTCEGARRRRAAAMGTWIAPNNVDSTAARQCGKCAKGLAERDEQISCECCQKPFHLKCVGLPSGYQSDFVCSKCVPKFKKTTAKKSTDEDDEE